MARGDACIQCPGASSVRAASICGERGSRAHALLELQLRHARIKPAGGEHAGAGSLFDEAAGLHALDPDAVTHKLDDAQIRLGEDDEEICQRWVPFQESVVRK